MKLFENAITNSKDIRQIKESFDIFRNDALSIFNFKDQMIDNLTRENQKLEQVNTMLKNKIVVFEEENNKKKFCVHCHEMFTQKFNEEVFQLYKVRNLAPITRES